MVKKNSLKALIFVVALSFVMHQRVFAGFTTMRVSIKNVTTSDKNTEIRLQILDDRSIEVFNCSAITLESEYWPIPWYTIFPYFRSSHPTVIEHREAIELLRKGMSFSDRVVWFGFMSDRFMRKSATERCTYLSTGLKIFDKSMPIVVSYFDN